MIWNDTLMYYIDSALYISISYTQTFGYETVMRRPNSIRFASGSRSSANPHLKAINKTSLGRNKNELHVVDDSVRQGKQLGNQESVVIARTLPPQKSIAQRVAHDRTAACISAHHFACRHLACCCSAVYGHRFQVVCTAKCCDRIPVLRAT